VHLPSLQQQVVACFAFLACFTGAPAAITDAHAKAMAAMLKLILFILIFLLNVYDKILAIIGRLRMVLCVSFWRLPAGGVIFR
jgi:phage-related protein